MLTGSAWTNAPGLCSARTLLITSPVSFRDLSPKNPPPSNKGKTHGSRNVKRNRADQADDSTGWSRAFWKHKGNSLALLRVYEELKTKESSNILATWCEEPTRWKRPWCWERPRAGREEGDIGWDGWTASPTQLMGLWANSERWQRTGQLGLPQSTGTHRAGLNLGTKQ